ncbi:MAG: ABC transporter ATP-binding protein, partial [Eubacteriales bacterium]
HNLRYALKYGSRLIMMHQGGIEMDVQGEEKNNLPMEQLLKKFNDISIECGN